MKGLCFVGGFVEEERKSCSLGREREREEE